MTPALSEEEACPIKMIDVEHTVRGDFVGGVNITHSCLREQLRGAT